MGKTTLVAVYARCPLCGKLSRERNFDRHHVFEVKAQFAIGKGCFSWKNAIGEVAERLKLKVISRLEELKQEVGEWSRSKNVSMLAVPSIYYSRTEGALSSPKIVAKLDSLIKTSKSSLLQ